VTARRAMAAALLAAVGTAALLVPRPALAQPAPAPGADEPATEPAAEAVADDAAPAAPPPPAGPLSAYFTELERIGLVDIATGTEQSLIRELDAAEALLSGGSPADAAVALYAIVYSPRYQDLRDFVAYQNAEYDLGAALAAAGASGEAATQLERVLARGPSAPYWGPAHRRMVDIALDTRDHAGILARLEAVKTEGPIPPGAAGERAYLRGRAAYDAGQLAAAEKDLETISKKSRLYSSALYVRALIRTRQGKLVDAAAALCEIADQPDDDRFTFVVDDRYFTIKDLARLGLGRIAHERAEYDDAYYHYFQIPDDSDKLPEALFEAAWSMYQKRELATSRDLVSELLRQFPTAPVWPEASLLGGYVELADCEFGDSQRYYDRLITRLVPIVRDMDAIRKNPHRRRDLFASALGRWRDERTMSSDDGDDENDADPARPAATRAATSTRDEILGLLRLDPGFVRLHDALAGMARTAGEAPGVVRSWQGLARQVAAARVGAVSGERTIAEEDAADASAVHQDLERLGDEVARARAELDRGRRAGTVPADAARDEDARLAALERKVADATGRARRAADAAADAVTGTSAPGLQPLVQADVARARRLERSAVALRRRLLEQADALAQRSIEKLYADTKRVLDKARLGKIDAVIGQKRSLDIQVQDLASGRFPPELFGRMWEEGLIGDDEELWPFEGEYWADEYENWR
jgi:hypothetical protein